MSDKLSAKTIRRLRRVKDYILAEPKLYDQDGFRACRPSSEKPCGSAACILGWAAALFPKTDARKETAMRRRRMRHLGTSFYPAGVCSEGTKIFAAAAVRLGLTHDQAERLWEAGRWPAKYYKFEVHAYGTSPRRARNAARRIEHFIKTNGNE